MNEIRKNQAFLSGLSVMIMLGFWFYPCGFATLVRQIVGENPASLLANTSWKCMISPGFVPCVFLDKELSEITSINYILVVSIFSLSPFVVSRTIHSHNFAKKAYRISLSEFLDNLKLLPLPVTYSFWEPLPFTWYPFFSRATSVSSFAIRNWSCPISSSVLLVWSAA